MLKMIVDFVVQVLLSLLTKYNVEGVYVRKYFPHCVWVHWFEYQLEKQVPATGYKLPDDLGITAMYSPPEQYSENQKIIGMFYGLEGTPEERANALEFRNKLFGIDLDEAPENELDWSDIDVGGETGTSWSHNP